MYVRIANREDHDQSDLGLPCLSRLFCSQPVFKILEHLPYFEIIFGFIFCGWIEVGIRLQAFMIF